MKETLKYGGFSLHAEYSLISYDYLHTDMRSSRQVVYFSFGICYACWMPNKLT